MVLVYAAARAMIVCVLFGLWSGVAWAGARVDLVQVRGPDGWARAGLGDEVWAATVLEGERERPIRVGETLAPGTTVRVRQAKVRLGVDACAELVLDEFSEHVVGEGCSFSRRAGTVL